MTVSASASASRPAWAVIENPAVVGTTGGRGAHGDPVRRLLVGPEDLRRDREVERDDRIEREDDHLVDGT